MIINKSEDANKSTKNMYIKNVSPKISMTKIHVEIRQSKATTYDHDQSHLSLPQSER